MTTSRHTAEWEEDGRFASGRDELAWGEQAVRQGLRILEAVVP
jgi:hypothetical protein